MFNINNNILSTFTNSGWNYYIWIKNFITFVFKICNYSILIISESSTYILLTTALTILR